MPTQPLTSYWASVWLTSNGAVWPAYWSKREDAEKIHDLTLSNVTRYPYTIGVALLAPGGEVIASQGDIKGWTQGAFNDWRRRA